MKSLSGEKGPRADKFPGEFPLIFKEYQSFPNSFQKFQRGGTLPNSL